MHKLCPFCHTWCSNNIYDEHVAGHMQKAADGQMKDHVTVRPQERFTGDIAKEPKWYVHPKCGGVTGMPEEIIRSYMVDPFLYNDSSFCTGCHTYVPTGELFWQETNESLLGASYRRKAEFIKNNNLNPDDFLWNASGPVRRKNRGGGGAGWGLAAVFVVGGLAALFLFGVVLVVGVHSFRQAARRQPPPPANAAMPNFQPAFQPAFQPMKFPEMPPMEMSKGPDIDKIFKERQEQMEKQLEESRQRQEKLLEDLRSQSLAPPGALAPPTLPEPAAPELAGPSGVASGLEAARQRAEESRKRMQERMEESRKRSQERMDALKERMKSRP
jgi:hypothetical protein